jgi:hydrogenase maturation protein HypF
VLTPVRTTATARRLRLEVRGAVQGVGFRPFVYRLAAELGVTGFIANDARGVVIEVEGDEGALTTFVDGLASAAPPQAQVESVEATPVTPVGSGDFRILASDHTGERSAVVLPDLAPCPDCMREVRDPDDRRGGYAFSNCTNCGPRFSIICELPYDRPGTTMVGFRMCRRCAEEYGDPGDRRFHAQPNACPACGPRLSLLDADGVALAGVASDAAAIRLVASALGAGSIIAVKGVGGFHLMANAADDGALRLLRERKGRPTKPLALMVADLAMARTLCDVDREAAALLSGPTAPIVLLPRLPHAPVAAGVAPDNPDLGIMLPSAPLHHLLLDEFGGPVVATSGNLSEEPICIGDGEAVERLRGIADLFLVHDRPIERHVDDSIVWLSAGEPRLLRRARGWAPLPVSLPAPVPCILAVGGELKNTVALSKGRNVFISQHIGDLATPEAQRAFERVIDDFLRLYAARPVAVACDAHPHYAATRWAERAVNGAAEVAPVLDRLPLLRVQHHHAHLASCLAENGAEGEALGVVWDGTGWGPDGTVWGGELLAGNAAGYRRLARLRPFPLLGGEAAVREGRRVAFALLAGVHGGDTPELDTFSDGERRVLATMLERGVGSPLTSSMGRLFDGIAALLGLRQRSTFEGEAALALEHAADRRERGSYPFPLVAEPRPGVPAELDWRPLVEAVLADAQGGVAVERIAGRFHNALVDAVLHCAHMAGLPHVALTGGCFQNRLLLERGTARLERAGFVTLLHRRVPPNDGGIALGQVAVAAAALGTA